eukprot:XP_011680767.1 PREDICTED: cytochrome P450 2D28-like [Strongylocentrotus purpuratus]
MRGFTIPKGAVIVSNISEVLNSEELWKDSGAFKPERFLTADGELIKRDELIFFSSGRRACPGEQLARMETFLGFTSLLQRFTFKKPDNSTPLSFEGVLGVSRNPVPYMTCAVDRRMVLRRPRRCQALTIRGPQCSRDAKRRFVLHYCKQHFKIHAGPDAMDVSDSKDQ